MADEVAPWYADLPDPVKAHITNRGHDKEDAPTAAAKLAEAHFAAQKFVGVAPEQILKLPKDGADPGYVDAYKRVAALSAPKEAAGYTFPEGTSENIVKAASEIAVKLGLPVHAASELAAHMTADAAQTTARTASERELARGVMDAQLRRDWGVNYDLNLFKANKAVEALGWDKDTMDRMQASVGGDKLLNSLLGLAGQMSEATILRGGGTATPTLTRDQALLRKAEIMISASQRQFTPVEMEAAQRELMSLAVIITGPPPR